MSPRWRTVALALAIVLGARLAMEAAGRNLAGLTVLRQVARSGLMEPSSDAASAPISPRFTPSLSPSTPLAVVEPWQALLQDQHSEEAALALGRAYDRGSHFARSLDAIARAELPYAPQSAVPFGLPAYQWALAIRASDAEDWHRALSHFMRAIVSHPGPWPASFVSGYRSAIEHAKPELARTLASEEAAPESSWHRVEVGRKNQRLWTVPLPAERGWSLVAVSVHSSTAIELGLPIRVRTSWISKEGVEKSRDLLTWNLAPNAGFEAAGALPGRALGWFQARSDTAGFAAVRRVAHHAGASNALSLVPDGGRTPLAFARAIPVRPGAFLLWRVRVTTEPGGNPIISLDWRDRTGRSMASEYPMQGNTLSTEEADYAGLLRVPSDARFLSLALGNWQAPGTVLWDDLLLLEVWPPTE